MFKTVMKYASRAPKSALVVMRKMPKWKQKQSKETPRRKYSKRKRKKFPVKKVSKIDGKLRFSSFESYSKF